VRVPDTVSGVAAGDLVSVPLVRREQPRDRDVGLEMRRAQFAL
jgi:hypothetical protein